MAPFWRFFFPNFGRAQEFIDELYFFKEDYSIVREVASQKWLLGSNFQGHQTILLVDLSGTANCISRGDGYNKYLIKDIEIVDSRYVYYCGTRVVSYTFIPDAQGNMVYTPTWGAMFGYFDLTTFTISNVQGMDDLVSIYNIESLDKLEVFHVDGETHLAMVGSMNSGEGCVIDLYGNGVLPSSWSYDLAQVPDEKFDDVAISEKKLVVSSRTPNVQSFLRSYGIPTSTGQTFFANPVAQIKTDISAYDSILLEYCEGDYFTLATTDVPNNNIEVAAFDHNLQFYYALTIPLASNETPLYSLRDIKYNPYLKTLAVLEVSPSQGFYNSLIHHLSTNNAPPTLSPDVYGTLYKNERLCSLDYESNNAGHIVASGNVENTCARIYQHFPYLYDECTIENHIKCEKLNPTENENGILETSPDSFVAVPINWSYYTWSETIICQ
ncbi:MAG: hypothetical protein J6X59_02465 [Bacteroidales bacterium]|nr:hypothetical protein [Bacteroidales bacterium]